jgi:predicted dehydrogenase
LLLDVKVADELRSAHVPALIANKTPIVAVYSRSTKSAESLVEVIRTSGGSASGIDVYSDEKGGGLPALLERSDFEAVIIALPILVQPDVVRQCLAAGKHVLCEKPIAKDVSDGLKLVEDYEKTYAPRNLVFSIAENFRCDNANVRAREIVASGEIGDLTHAHGRSWFSVLPGVKWYETEWRKNPEYQGGFLLDAGVHFIALMRTVAGQEIVETKSLASQHWPHLPPTDTIDAALRFSDGATGSISLSCASVKSVFEFIFIGTKGTLTITRADTPDTSKIRVENAESKTEREETVEGKGIYEEIKAFVRAAETNTPDKSLSPREALRDVAVIESLCTGGGVIRHS